MKKLKTKFSNKFKKTLFLGHFESIFPIFRQNKFSWKIRLSRTTLYGSLVPCQNLEKVKDRQKEGQKDRQTLFYRTLPGTTRGPEKELEFPTFE